MCRRLFFVFLSFFKENVCTQAKEGYDGIENNVRPRLAEETQLLGGFLLGFEVRELRFPRLDTRNIHRAQQEAKLSVCIFHFYFLE